jgi:hypothetical protein
MLSGGAVEVVVDDVAPFLVMHLEQRLPPLYGGIGHDDNDVSDRAGCFRLYARRPLFDARFPQDPRWSRASRRSRRSRVPQCPRQRRRAPHPQSSLRSPTDVAVPDRAPSDLQNHRSYSSVSRRSPAAGFCNLTNSGWARVYAESKLPIWFKAANERKHSGFDELEGRAGP